MKKTVTVILLFICAISFAQQKEELLKTSVIDSSVFTQKNKAYGYELIDVTARFASEIENKLKIEEAITNREFIYDTLLIEVVTPANCCASFECDLEVTDNDELNLIFTKDDLDCFCLKGIYLTYKIAVKSRDDHVVKLNNKELSYRKYDPNESRDVTEFYDNGQIKNIKMYLGADLKRVSYFDETGKRTKMIMYNNGKVIEKNY